MARDAEVQWTPDLAPIESNHLAIRVVAGNVAADYFDLALVVSNDRSGLHGRVPRRVFMMPAGKGSVEYRILEAIIALVNSLQSPCSVPNALARFTRQREPESV